MKLIFDHTKGFGKMRDKVIFYMPFGAFFDQSEYDEALNTGWFPANKDIWFQSRSTRINLSLYESNRTTEKIAKDIRCYPDVRMTPEKKARLEEIYKKYLAYKQYKNISFSIDDMIANSHGHIYYTYENKIIGFLFFKIVNKNFLAVEFGWDYENPKLSLGNVSIHYAAILAKTRRCTHMYMSAGYESCCAYKANYKGFEWWTGYSWSNDTEQYKKLCYEDDLVIILDKEEIDFYQKEQA